MPQIYEIKTHHKYPQQVAEYWRKDGICAVGHQWSYSEEYNGEPAQGQWGLFQQIRKGDLILAYARPCMIAYVGDVADSELRCEKRNSTGRNYKYWNQRKVNWWTDPNHFHPRDLPAWIRRQLGSRGQTIKRLDLKSRTFGVVKKIIETQATSGSALASLDEEMVKAGIRSYFLSHAQVFECGLRIHRIEREVARGYRPDFEGEDAKGRPVIVECKGYASARACGQLVKYAKKHSKGRRQCRLLLVAFGFERACRKIAPKAGIELFRCVPNFLREPRL